MVLGLLPIIRTAVIVLTKLIILKSSTQTQLASELESAKEAAAEADKSFAYEAPCRICGFIPDAAVEVVDHEQALKFKRPVEIESTDISEYFQHATGMTAYEANAKLVNEGGSKIRIGDIELAFSDATEFRRLRDANPENWDKFRSVLNDDDTLPKDIEAAIAAGYAPTADWRNAYHNSDENPTIKLLGPGGHREAIYSKVDGDLYLGDHKGTFNFFSPYNETSHVIADMAPVDQKYQPVADADRKIDDGIKSGKEKIKNTADAIFGFFE